MAGKVFFSVTMSLDGFIAPEERVDDPDGQRWREQWMELQRWIFPLWFFRENLKLGEGGEEGRANDIARETFERTGASVMGKRMFEAGEQMWPEEAPFHTPVFVVTHEKRDPWERPGGTTFYFVNAGIAPTLDQAREAAGDLACLVERELNAVVDEVEGGSARPLPGVTLLVGDNEDRRVERRLLRPHLLAGVEHALARGLCRPWRARHSGRVGSPEVNYWRLYSYISLASVNS